VARGLTGSADGDGERRAKARALVEQGLTAAAAGRLDDALHVWKEYLAAHLDDEDAPAVRDAIAASERLVKALEGIRGD
jgi:hypothetical protein